MPSNRYLLSRTVQAIVTLFSVISFTFVMVRWMPGGPEDYFMAKMMNQDIDPQQLNVMMESYTNLRPDQPLHVQYISYMSSMLQGDLGISIWYQEPVLDIIIQALPWTIYLSAVSMVIIFSIGIAYGAAMAYKEGGRFDVASSISWILIESVPYYVFAVVMLWIFSYSTDWFPIGGRVGAHAEPGFTLPFILTIIEHSALPILSLVITGIGGIALGMRGNSISVLGEDYLRVARLRGLPDGIISTRYVGRNAILPMYTSMMISIGSLFGGSIILETLFNYPGIGYYMFEAVSARDYPLMMGSFLFITIGVIVGVYIADLTYGFVDPRAGSSSTRESYGGGISLESLVRFVRGIRDGLVSAVSTSADEPDSRKASNGGIETPDAGSPFTAVSGTSLSRREQYWRAFDEKVLTTFRVISKDWRALVGLSIITVFVLMGTVGVLVVAPPEAGKGPVLLQPFQTMEYPLGTSDLGESLFAQTVHATPAMLKMVVGGAVFATGMSLIWGVFAGYAGGSIDRAMMTIADILMTIPGLPLIIVISTLLQPRDPFVVGIILTINGWAGFARALRSQVLTLRNKSYVEASRTMQLSTPRILFIDIIPNLMPLVMVNFVGRARSVIISSVALYFLGILPYSTANWGVMLQSAYSSATWYNMNAVHWILVPILTIVVFSLGLILFGQGMDRIFNPRIRARHMKTTPDTVAEH
ncbi:MULTISPECIES: ABC transporter permease subunit [unclassified Haladaptatus]|uniref:ABC transporter permease subunit n=1 Tax=unclassified Haladaptatus TaxID=2622732 RepID=UPI0023E81CD9|nr:MULTISPECIES: ABC transporter permease subunit [unclassified Haladaptatus]